MEVVGPGLIVVKQSRGDEPGKFVNVAVLEGDQIKVIDEGASALEGCPDLVTSLLGVHRIGEPSEHVNVLVQLAVSIRDHRRGGTLLGGPSKQPLVARIDRVACLVFGGPQLFAVTRPDERRSDEAH